MRLVPRADGHGRVPAVDGDDRDPFIRDCIINKGQTKAHPRGHRRGVSQYGMQTSRPVDLPALQEGAHHLRRALRRASNPDEFKLKIQGIQSTSDMAAEEDGEDHASFDME